MKAYIHEKYGPPQVLKAVEIEKPTPNSNEVLVKVCATTVCAGDVRLRSSDFPFLYWLLARLIFGLFRPKKKILGHEFSGVVEQVGKKVNGFKEGDEVFGTTTMLKKGSYAQYVCVPQKWKHGVLSIKPNNMSHIESAVLPIGAMTALFLLEKGKISGTEEILIYGASGSVGTYAVQLAKNQNARVTGVCSTSNIKMVTNLGAEHVIDYLKEDFTKLAGRFDIFFDAVGKVSKRTARKMLKEKGRFVSVKMMTKEKDVHIKKIKSLVEKGEILPVIDRIYRFDGMVDAHTYVDNGHKKGNVVVLVDQSL